MNDRIADMMIRIKNAGAVALPTTAFPYSKITESICKLLKEKGYIADYSVKGKKVSTKSIEVQIGYNGKIPKVSDAQRISKLSRRVYGGFEDFKSVKNGKGMLVVSTPKGIMDGKDAKAEKVGGEMLFKVW